MPEAKHLKLNRRRFTRKPAAEQQSTRGVIRGLNRKLRVRCDRRQARYLDGGGFKPPSFNSNTRVVPLT